MDKIIGGTLKVNNCPADVENGYMVVINDNSDLWYYGLYDDFDRAKQAATETDNRFVVKI